MLNLFALGGQARQLVVAQKREGVRNLCGIQLHRLERFPGRFAGENLQVLSGTLRRFMAGGFF
jgi:hypothetical protein